MMEPSMLHVAFVPILIALAIVLVPILKIIHKAGYSRIWVLVLFIPFVNLVFLWIFAFSRWPVEGNK